MMTRRWFSLLTLLAAATLVLPLLAGPAAAQSLDELRASGKVGERYDGFAEARDPAVAAQVKEINAKRTAIRSEEHTSELQSLMRTSYAVFCLKKKKKRKISKKKIKQQTDT